MFRLDSRACVPDRNLKRSIGTAETNRDRAAGRRILQTNICFSSTLSVSIITGLFCFRASSISFFLFMMRLSPGAASTVVWV